MAVVPDRQRSDAVANHERILSTAMALLQANPDATADDIATAAEISRSSLYRHFGTRQALAEAARSRNAELSEANVLDALRPAGELAAAAGPFDVAAVLNKVPPHLLGEQIVAEAQRLAGVRSVAVYVVDIDGTRLRRLAGSQEFPDELPLALAVGPEIPREAVPGLKADIAERLPASVVAPMMIRGRALGVLIAVDAPETPLRALAIQAGVALELAEKYTDVFDAARRRRDITAASEIQQNMLPPRIARISGGVLAGNVLPGYDIGGDWFDYVENPNGTWMAVADSYGKGTTAAAIGSITLGAFRAKRRRQATLGDTVKYMEDTLAELQAPNAFCNVIVAFWHGPSGGFFWISCGDQQPYLISADRSVRALPGTTHPSLGRGTGERDVKADSHRLAGDERILLISDGVLDRRRRGGGILGLEAVRAAVSELVEPTAPAIVRAIERQIEEASDDNLEDDATVVAFAPTTPRNPS